jgi:hypothetical protein
MAYVIAPVFKKYGIVKVDPKKWYPLQPLLDALYEMSKQSNGHQSLVTIGVKIAMYAQSLGYRFQRTVNLVTSSSKTA